MAETLHVLEVLPANSSITSVNLYSGHAEITRAFKIHLEPGYTQLDIPGLPSSINRETLRVHGKGNAIIHDVGVSSIERAQLWSTPVIDTLEDKKRLVEKALERCNHAAAFLERYIGSMSVQHLEASNILPVLETYDDAGGKMAKKALELEKKLKEIEDKINEERSKIQQQNSDNTLLTKVSVTLYAAQVTDMKLGLIYGVTGATWDAKYSIRVISARQEKSVVITYKASVINKTGEPWNNTPLTLETITPVFDADLPILNPWTLSFPKGSGGKGVKQYGKSTIEKNVGYHDLEIASKGNTNAAFVVPGKVSVPSDGAPHDYTITELELDATLLWEGVPKIDKRVHFKARIANRTPYTLVPGEASIYVDGNFISRSSIQLVDSGATFECPLGIDPSLRITYYPRTKSVAKSGFYNQSTIYSFSQRITIASSKLANLGHLKVIDNIPISNDPNIVTKLLEPALTIPSSSTSLTICNDDIPSGCTVCAQWDGTDEAKCDVQSLGKDGKINWVCKVAPKKTLSVTMRWEVSTTLAEEIQNLGSGCER